MSDRELNRAVAQATGECVETIQQLGFQLASEDDDPSAIDDADLGPSVVDWDDKHPVLLHERFEFSEWPPRIAPIPSHDDDESDEDDAHSSEDESSEERRLVAA